MKEFMEWIENEINPKRKQMGLDTISREEQIKCYDIFTDFQKKIAEENNVYIVRTGAGQKTCTRPDVLDCHARNGTGGFCMNIMTCPPKEATE